MSRLVAAVLVLAVSTSTNAIAIELEYELEVKGMVCAFCAYNVAKQLRSLDGVASDSIEVDLDSGKVKLRSDRHLQAAKLTDRVEAAGFALEAIAEKTAEPVAPPPRSERQVLISLTVDAEGLGQGAFDNLLEALGAFASERSAAMTVAGPARLELRALRPMLMGRTPAVDVEFTESVRPDDTVLINVLAE